MPKTIRSNRQMREVRKAIPKASRHPVGEAVVRQAEAPPPLDYVPDRDGLAWLVDKRRRRITVPQCQEGLHYRKLFRVADPGAAIKSSIENLGMGGGAGKGSPVSLGGSYDDAQAKLELYVIREHLFGGQRDLVTVMDAVAGQGWTVRFLAGGDKVKAAQWEQTLRIALDLMLENRRLKEGVKKAA